MIDVSLEQICSAVSGQLIEAGKSSNSVINAVSTDTRTVEEGHCLSLLLESVLMRMTFVIKR